MAKPLLDDDLWNLIEPLLPPPKPRRFKYPGRKPLDRRKALTGILFVLKTGIPWESLPQEMGCGCGMSCWRYLQAWQKAGVWEKVHKALLDRLRTDEQLDLSAAVVDSSHVRAVGGAKIRLSFTFADALSVVSREGGLRRKGPSGGRPSG